MLNKLLTFIRRYEMIRPGDSVVCAVSGGADSIALLWAFYLLKDKLDIRLSAAHFNHQLRGTESDRDAAFVASFCGRYDIPLHTSSALVKAGEKGLEAAAREARYSFLCGLPGKIATAHTADDNAETVLMHLVRGTGLKGLGGIAPVRGNLIRPMLTVTRQEVVSFLEEYHLDWCEDSSNQEDIFLRNRLRHRVMPLLREENPRLSENLTEMALSLREDEAALAELAGGALPSVSELRKMPPAVRKRLSAAFLERNGVKEPERSHIALMEELIFSDNPSARGAFPGKITVSRCYDRLERQSVSALMVLVPVEHNGITDADGWGVRIACKESRCVENGKDCFTVNPVGQMLIRSRQPGDSICLSGGRKSLKKLFIDRKIPVRARPMVPVLADDKGVLAVCGIGPNLERIEPGIQVQLLPLAGEEKD